MATPCRGVTKRGTPCAATWGLNVEGFCKFHVPNAVQCRGIARSTGHQCRVKWDLDQFGFCRSHRSVPVRQCVAIAQTSGKRCLKTVGIDRDGFCSAHKLVENSNPFLCQGTLLNTGTPCMNPVKPRYSYCCAAHDPVVKYYSPSLFGASNLRSSMENDVLKLYRGRDLYHGDPLDLTTHGFVEMDHILEKQCFSYAFHYLPSRDYGEGVDYLAEFVKDEVVNELDNLCLTRTTTNRIKGAAVWKFLDDCLTGHVGYRGSATFYDYLLAENRDDIRLGRATTRVISAEMGTALKFCQRRLADQGETPMIDALSDQLQRLYVRMQLKTSRGAVTPTVTKSLPSKAKSRGGTRRTAHPESVSENATTSLGAGGVSIAPQGVPVTDLMSTCDSKQATSSDEVTTPGTLSNIVKSVESSDPAMDANADNKLNNSDSADVKNTAVETTEHCDADPKSVDSTSREANANRKILNAFAKPFVLIAVQGSDLPHQIDQTSRESTSSEGSDR